MAITMRFAGTWALRGKMQVAIARLERVALDFFLKERARQSTIRAESSRGDGK